jgi:cation diffusion facilitator family transporter
MTADARDESSQLVSPSRTALVTVAIALTLFGAKLAAAWFSGSIGLLSTAIDSGLDLGMSLVVLLGIRLAQVPADPEHPYGHGKFESVAGLVEAGVLAAVGILVAAIGVFRVLDPEPVALDAWMVAVLVVSALVGAERGYTLWTRGREHGSAALSVDAWHYATDVVTSLLGLAGAWLASRGLPWADGGAAILVGGLLAAGSVHVGWRAAGDLVDRVPPTLTERVTATVRSVDGVEAVGQVRVRGAGPDTFVDATVEIPRSVGLERAHDVMDAVELAVDEELGGADVTVHAEPVAARETALTELKVLAAREADIVGIHEILVDEIGGELYVDCHVEVDQDVSLAEAHAIAQRFETRAKREITPVAGLRTHIEPAPRDPREGEDVTEEHPALVEAIRTAIEEGPFTGSGSIALKRAHRNLEAVITARLAGETSLEQAHRAAHELEHHVLGEIGGLDRVVVHVEPEKAD